MNRFGGFIIWSADLIPKAKQCIVFKCLSCYSMAASYQYTVLCVIFNLMNSHVYTCTYKHVNM